jgi:hypothetical protein
VNDLTIVNHVSPATASWSVGKIVGISTLVVDINVPSNEIFLVKGTVMPKDETEFSVIPFTKFVFWVEIVSSKSLDTPCQ